MLSTAGGFCWIQSKKGSPTRTSAKYSPRNVRSRRSTRWTIRSNPETNRITPGRSPSEPSPTSTATAAMDVG